MFKYSSPTSDEVFNNDGSPRPAARALIEHLSQLSGSELAERKLAAELAIKQMGITFTVYSDEGNIDRDWPFDIIPRVIDSNEWLQIKSGLIQRLEALNLFINDLYNDQKIITDGIVPASLLETSCNFREQCRGITPRYGVWAHICGSDLVRDHDDTMYVLEDNLRVPSGVSYMIENREVMKRTLPEVFSSCKILPVNDYVGNLGQMLRALSDKPEPVLCVLTPGVFNSAYFEHSFLARELGAELVEGRDLVVEADECVYFRNVDGLKKVDVIYRRIDDEFLDPECFNPKSTLGVSGLMRAWRAGNVAIANAPGAGVADDKVIYSYVPDIIRYYLNEEPLIDNVPTYRCENDEQREYVLNNIEKLVVKPANESGGYGLLIGPHSTEDERKETRKNILADPRNYVAQPTLAISTSPTLVNEELVPRHVDLRPFILQSDVTTVTTGGLTRVALVEGSLIVNSSQGGGSKDTWVVQTTHAASESPKNDTHKTLAQSQSQSHSGGQSHASDNGTEQN